MFLASSVKCSVINACMTDDVPILFNKHMKVMFPKLITYLESVLIIKSKDNNDEHVANDNELSQLTVSMTSTFPRPPIVPIET